MSIPPPKLHSDRAPRQNRDFIELDRDVSASPLWNRDLAPTTLAQRTWTTWNIAALWVGMSVVITSYEIAGGMIEAGMNWREALGTVFLGNCIVLIPMCLNAHAGAKYGLAFPVLCRASFGTLGANVPALMRAVVACGWFGIQTWLGGTALDACVSALWPGWSEFSTLVFGVSLHAWIAFFMFWLVEVYFIVRGLEGIKLLESWSAPLLLGGGLALLWWASSKAGGLQTALDASVNLQNQHGDFWTLFPPHLTASIGYWATLSTNIPDFTRFARSQRSQILGQAIGLPLTMGAMAFLGITVTSATVIIYGRPVPHVVDIVRTFGSWQAILAATVVIFFAQLSTNMAANVVSPSNDFSNLSPRRISYVMGGLITALLGVVMMPWNLVGSLGAYVFTWLIGYSMLMGAICAILICDYWVLRRQQLDVAALFDPAGKYSYRHGINWRAMAALVVSMLPCLPGFVRAATTSGGVPANPNFFDTIYTYAWFVTFALGFVIYGLLMRGHSNLQQELNTHGTQR